MENSLGWALNYDCFAKATNDTGNVAHRSYRKLIISWHGDGNIRVPGSSSLSVLQIGQDPLKTLNPTRQTYAPSVRFMLLIPALYTAA